MDEVLPGEEQVIAAPEIRDELLLVSCYFQPYQVGGGVNLLTLPFWEKMSRDGTVASRDKQAGPAGEWGISADMIQRWRENGIRVAVGSEDIWPEVVKTLQDQGARAMPGRSAYYRLTGQTVDFPLHAVGSQTVFLFRGGAAPRGREWPAGQIFFRIGCRPYGDHVENGPCFFSVVPVVVNAEQPLHYPGVDIPEAPGRRELIIDELLLEGALPPHRFLCIAPLDADNDINNGGKVLLTFGEEPAVTRWVVLLAPRMITGKQVKKQIETARQPSP